MATGHRIADLPGPRGTSVTAVAFSQGGQTLAVGDAHGSTHVWDVAARHVIATITDPLSTPVSAVAFSQDGQTLATGDK